jgi:hypothetical protein
VYEHVVDCASSGHGLVGDAWTVAADRRVAGARVHVSRSGVPVAVTLTMPGIDACACTG